MSRQIYHNLYFYLLIFWSSNFQAAKMYNIISVLFISQIGGIPYEDTEVTELVDQLNKGYRLSKPDNTSDEMYVV